MIKLIIGTGGRLGPLILRLFLGAVFFPHGAQKVLGWFGGHGFAGTMQFFTEKMHIPVAFAFLAIAAEFAGSFGLIFGCLTRIAALGICANMVVAIVMVHAQHGFFMNWFGTQQGEGIEFHLLAIGIALALVIQGGGLLSIDRYIQRKCEGA